MKKNHYMYILAAAALTLGACSSDKDVVDEEIANAVPQEGEAMTFKAASVGGIEVLADEDLDAPGTPSAKPRTIDINTEGTGMSISQWYTTDKISISDGTLNYTYSPSTTSPNCEFNAGGNDFLTSSGANEKTFYAFYPQEAGQSWNGSTISAMVWTEQLYEENLPGGVLGPYVVATATAETTGSGATAEFKFGYICSVIDVDISAITSETVDAVSLYANSQASIAGSLKYNFGTKVIGVLNSDNPGYSFSTQSEVIRVSNVPSGATVVRFYLLPTVQSQGFTITVHTTSDNYYTKSSSKPVGNSSVNTDYITSVTNGIGGQGMSACLPYYKKYNFGSITASNVRKQNWMAMIPGNIKFNHLSIPGTHNAATSSCSNVSAKCQAYTIAEQLQKGCRALDLRPLYNSTTLEIGHGTTSYGRTGVTLANALEAVKTFLTANPTETVFVLIAQEGGDDGNTDWQNRVWNCLSGYTDYIASYGWQGNLNPCRGKMVVIFRNSYTGGDNNGDLGCGKVGWGSSFNDKTIMTGNNSNTGRGTLRYQDEYNTSSTTTKLGNLTTMLNDHIHAKETDAGYTFVNNVNIAGTLSNISDLSTSMNNAVLNSTTFTNHTGKFGIMMVDFLHSSDQYGNQMFELIHKQNYKYVYQKRTRNTSSSATGTGVEIAGDEYADNSEVFAKER